MSVERIYSQSVVLPVMFDPEATAGNGFSNGKTYPLSKTISFGLNITL